MFILLLLRLLLWRIVQNILDYTTIDMHRYYNTILSQIIFQLQLSTNHNRPFKCISQIFSRKSDFWGQSTEQYFSSIINKNRNYKKKFDADYFTDSIINNWSFHFHYSSALVKFSIANMAFVSRIFFVRAHRSNLQTHISPYYF